MKFWTMLEKKGRWSTLIAIIISIPLTGLLIYKGIFSKPIDTPSFLIGYTVSMMFFILPSKIVIKHKETSIEIED